MTKCNGDPFGFSSEAKEVITVFAERLRTIDLTNGSNKALAFWLRESNIQRMENSYLSLQSLESSVRRPVGQIFQIAPSNVDLLFLYVWSIAFLLGNSITTKLGSRLDSELVAPVIETLLSVLDEFEGQATKNLFVAWDREDPQILDQIRRADLVVGWGSDATIKNLRKLSVEADSDFLGFPHRFSCSLVNADLLHELDVFQRNVFLRRFVSELSEFDQGACTSPKALVLVGQAQNRVEFLDALRHEESTVAPQQESGYLRFVNKILLVQDSLLELPLSPVVNPGVEVIRGFDNVQQINDLRCVLGILPIVELENVGSLDAVLNRPIQTLSIWGFNSDEIQEQLSFSGIHPLRLVRVGATHSFDFMWDGNNLISAFSWPQSRG